MRELIVLKSIGIMVCGIVIGIVGVGWASLEALRKKDDLIRHLRSENDDLQSRLTMTADQLYEHLLRHEQ